MNNPFNNLFTSDPSQDGGGPMASSNHPASNSGGSNDREAPHGRPADITNLASSLPGAFQPSQPMASTTPVLPSQGQLPQHSGSPPVPRNPFQPPQNIFAPGMSPGTPYGFPWPMLGQFPQQTGMPPTGPASPIQPQARHTSSPSPGVSGAPNPMSATSSALQPTWATPEISPPQPGQHSLSGTATFSPQQGQMDTYGMSPWLMAGFPPMPMSPQMTGSQPMDPSWAQQAAMYQQYMQAASGQPGPGGISGWPPMPAWPPPPWMYSMFPNVYPPGLPQALPATVPSTAENSGKTQSSTPSRGAPIATSPPSRISENPSRSNTPSGHGLSASPPPYTDPKSSNMTYDPSRNKPQSSGDTFGQVNARMSAMSLGPNQAGPDPRNAPPGLKPLKKGKITIIIVGETGVGKTAFMNLLANACAGRPVDQFRHEHDSRNESNLDKNQSQTNAAMMYTFERRDGVQLRMLDTPGLCDTRGLEQDKEHKKSIAETIRDQVQTLDAVIIMANGTVERVGPGIEYALHTLAAMFPRSIADNIGFMFTNVPDALSFNFQPDTLPKEIQHAEVWTIQNPVAQFSKYQEARAGGRSSARQLQSMEKLLQSNYATTMETLNDFFSWLDQRKAQPTNAIVDLYDMTTNIEAAITNVLAQIDQRERQRMDLKKLQNDLDRNKQVMNVNRQYQSIMQRDTHVQKDTTYHNTLCGVPQCYSNCHLRCQLDFLMDRSELHRRCWAFYNGDEFGRLDNCRECGHSWQDHHHFHTEWEVEQQNETIVDDEAKQKFTTAQSQADSITFQKQQIEQAIQRFEEELRQHEEHLGQLCLQFQELALSGSFSGHLASAIRMLEVRLATMKSSGSDSDSIERMEERIESLRKRYDIVEKARGTAKSSFTISESSRGQRNTAPGSGEHGRSQGWNLARFFGGGGP